jgi:hypothetical protein
VPRAAGIPPPGASGELPAPEQVWLTIWKSAESFGPPGTPPIETPVMVSGRSPVFWTATGVWLFAAGVKWSSDALNDVTGLGPTSAWAPAATRKTAPVAARAAHPIARRLNALMLLPLFVAPRAGRWTVGPASPERT